MGHRVGLLDDRSCPPKGPAKTRPGAFGRHKQVRLTLFDDLVRDSLSTPPPSLQPTFLVTAGQKNSGAMWFEAVSWSPRAFVFHNFLTKEVRLPSAPQRLCRRPCTLAACLLCLADAAAACACTAGLQAPDRAGHAAHGEVGGRRQRHREERRQQVCTDDVAFACTACQQLGSEQLRAWVGTHGPAGAAASEMHSLLIRCLSFDPAQLWFPQRSGMAGQSGQRLVNMIMLCLCLPTMLGADK